MFLLKKYNCYLLLLLLLFPIIPAPAQDNPDLDQVPAELRNRKNVLQPKAITGSVITINNWDNFELGTDFAEGNIAENPGIPAWYFTAYNINVTHQTQNGLDWNSLVPSFGASMQGDPVVAYDSLGNLFYENMYGSNIQGCKVIKSTDNGLTWGPSVTAIAGNDKNWIACDQTSGPFANYVYTTMTNNSTGAFARSTDHGASFENTFNPTTQTLPGMMVCVGPDGNIQGGSVYVVTNSGSGYASTYTFYKSTDGGLSFTKTSAQNFSGYVGTYVNQRNSVENMRTRPYPFITADNSYGPHRGRLYLVYASNDPAGNGYKPDIFLRYSDNGGGTWSAAKRINDDVNPSAHHQWHPAVWCDKSTGRLYVQWMDTRNCVTSDSAMIYATYSDNGGASFVPNVAVSNEKMKIDCSTCGGGGSPRYQGDYNGVISNRKTSMLSWTDFRAGSFKSMTAYFPDFAMSLSKSRDTLFLLTDSTSNFNVSIPAVKAYSDSVLLTAQVVPAVPNIEVTFPNGNLLTSYPSSKPVHIQITGPVTHGVYQIIIRASGPNGTPVHQRIFELYLKAFVEAAVSESTICPGSSTHLNAFISGGTPPYTFAWTPAATVSDPTIPDPLATPEVTTWYKITVTDNAAHTGTDSVLVRIIQPPATPGPISGPVTTCQLSAVSYSIDSVPDATAYSWTVPSGAVITSGQNSRQINLTWGNTGGNISVIAGNTCGNSNPQILPVMLLENPVVPDTIEGPDTVCSGTDVAYSVEEITGVTSYTWIVPADAIITGGQGTSHLQVQMGNTSGIIAVFLTNSCGSGAPAVKAVAIENLPGQAGIITGPDTVCINHSDYQYSVAPMLKAKSYTWSVPFGASIISGDGTCTVALSFGSNAVSGLITVAGNNQCGNGASSAKSILARDCTGTDDISEDDGVQVHPNPTNGFLAVERVKNHEKLLLQVISINGKIMYEWDFPEDTAVKKLDISSLPKGMYYLKFISSKGISIKKIILQ
ncbi:MAG: T9SS type A sorting domain-containing protein [Syntrophothermus sp.]